MGVEFDALPPDKRDIVEQIIARAGNRRRKNRRSTFSQLHLITAHDLRAKVVADKS